MNPDEVGNMSNSMCIIKIRSLDPFLTKKYDYPKHPNYHLTGDADDSLKYINTLDNSSVSVNKENALLEVHKARYQKLREAALKGKALYTKEVPLEEFIKNRSPEKAIDIFEKYSVVETFKADDPKIEAEAKKAFIEDLLQSIDEEKLRPVLQEIQKKKSEQSNERLPLEAQIESKIAETLADDTDGTEDFMSKYF